MSWRPSHYGQPGEAPEYSYAYAYSGTSGDQARLNSSALESDPSYGAGSRGTDESAQGSEFQIYQPTSGARVTTGSDASFSPFPYRDPATMHSNAMLPTDAEPSMPYVQYHNSPELSPVTGTSQYSRLAAFYSSPPLTDVSDCAGYFARRDIQLGAQQQAVLVDPYPSYTSPTPATLHHYGSLPNSYQDLPSQMEPGSITYGAAQSTAGDSAAESSPSIFSDSPSPSVGTRHVVRTRQNQGARPERSHTSDLQFSFVAPAGTVKKRPRRKAEDIDRIYKCGWGTCLKGYGTLNHLNAHVKTSGHGEKRRPEEFKEIRATWKRQKAEERRAAQQNGQSLQSAAANDADVRTTHILTRRVTDLGPGRPAPYPTRGTTLASRDSGPIRGVNVSSSSRFGAETGMAASSATQHLAMPTGYGSPHGALQGTPSISSTPRGAGVTQAGNDGVPRPTWAAVPARHGGPSPPPQTSQSPYVSPNPSSEYFVTPIRVPLPPSGFGPASGPSRPSPGYPLNSASTRLSTSPIQTRPTRDYMTYRRVDESAQRQ